MSFQFCHGDVCERERKNDRDKVEERDRGAGRETERLHEDLRSNNSSCPARRAPAWLTGLPGSLITSRCAVAKPTGKIPLISLCCKFCFSTQKLPKKEKKKLTTVLVKAEVMLKDPQKHLS